MGGKKKPKKKDSETNRKGRENQELDEKQLDSVSGGGGLDNTGLFNTGSSNTGLFNTGGTDTGSSNTGLFNTGSTNTGLFNTGGPTRKP